jgi:branched-chain amino acid transport system permease protein
VLLQVLFNGVSAGATLALLAIGLTLVFGILRVLNFAHGAMLMIGAYATYWLVEEAGLSYYISILGAALFVALIGAVLAMTVFRRFQGMLVEGAIAAVALALLMINGAFVLFPAAETVDGGIDGVIEVGDVRLISHRIFIIGVSLALVAALALFVSRTRYGRALRAVQQDPYVARLQGIDVNRVNVLTFALGGALAGVAGALVAPEAPLVPSMGDTPLLLALVVIIVGGMGSITGALYAALGIGLLQSAVSTYWVAEAATWTSFGLAVLVLTIRPRGLLGHA